MMNESKTMREVHEIREHIYEETKNMTSDEHTAYYRKAAQEMIEKHGLKVKRPSITLSREII